MSTNLLSRTGKLLALLIGLLAAGLLTVGFFSDLSCAEDSSVLIGNHPIQAVATASIGNAEASLPLEMRIHFATRDPAALDQLLTEQQNRASPRYHRWLRSGEFLRRFGPTDSDVKAVAEWIRNEGFTISDISDGHLQFSGVVAQAQRTFSVRIGKFGAGDVYANTSDPIIPQRFSHVIAAITGMDNIVHAVPMTRRSDSSFLPDAIAKGVQSFGPNDLRSFYDETVGGGRDGGGDCIAIVGTSDFLDSSMTTFANQFGMPPISYRRELHGQNPGINGAEVEAELDLQWSHAAAPGAPIVFHLGSDLAADINGAVSDNACGVISISFGFCGSFPAFMTSVIDPMFRQAAAQGQSVFVSSGDQGAAGFSGAGTNPCALGTSPSVNEMSADPNVTSVGGTQFTPVYSNNNEQGYVVEKVWNDASGAGGGGASEVFPKPAYQSGPGVPNDGARDVPDVAIIASPNAPGVFIAHDVGGSPQVVCCLGGTSLSAPVWAGFSRVTSQIAGNARLGNMNPLIYQLAATQYGSAGFHDVTVGNNNFNGVTGFSAAPEYDQATGWGTVDFNVFANAVENLLSATPTPTATPTPGATPTATDTPLPTATPTPTPSPTPAGGALSAPASVRLPSLKMGKPAASRTFLIRNRSRKSAMSVSVGTLAAPFVISGAGNYSIPAGARIPVTIFFIPDEVGTAHQELMIVSSDPKHPQIGVAVSGLVRR